MHRLLAVSLAFIAWNTTVGQTLEPILLSTSTGTLSFPSLDADFAIWNEIAERGGARVTHLYNIETGTRETIESAFEQPALIGQTLGFVMDAENVLCFGTVQPSSSCDSGGGTGGREPWIQNMLDGSRYPLWTEPHLLQFVDVAPGDEWIAWSGSLLHSSGFYPGTGWNVYARRLGESGPVGPMVEVAAGPSIETEPSSAGSFISWTSREQSNREILLRNMETNEVTNVGPGDFSTLSEEYIAWTGTSQVPTGVWVAPVGNLAARQQLSGEDASERIDIHEDAVVWADTSTIYHFDVSTGGRTEFEIPLDEDRAGRVTFAPSLYEDRIFWIQEEWSADIPFPPGLEDFDRLLETRSVSAYLVQIPEPASSTIAVAAVLCILNCRQRQRV